MSETILEHYRVGAGSFLTAEILGPDNYRRVCEVAELEPIPSGYGLLYATDENGERWTLVSDDLDYVATLLETADSLDAGVVDLPAAKFHETPIMGWLGNPSREGRMMRGSHFPEDAEPDGG